MRAKRIKDSLNASTINLKEYEYVGYVVTNAPLLYTKELNVYEYVCNGHFPMIQILCPYIATYSEPISTLQESYYGDRMEKYSIVTEYHGTNGINGKTVYGYTDLTSAVPPGMLGVSALPSGTGVFKKISGGGYEGIKGEGKGYIVPGSSGDYFSDAANPREVRTWGLDFDKDRDAFETSGQDCGGAAGSLCYPAEFWQVSIRLISSPALVDVETYSDHGPEITKNLIYEVEKKLAPVSIYSIDSKGNIRIEKFKYPVDFPGITATDTISAGIKNLISKHVITTPIEKSVFLQNSDSSNTRLISSVFTAYRPDTAVPYKLYNIPLEAPIFNFSPAGVSGGAVSKDSRYNLRVYFSQYDANEIYWSNRK
ncbi:MAG: hypothetical protein IPO53_11800 [Chitinophagaceae bacterium]|nr:hypothetical protein [Chitinophagaceae bacterium]